MSELELAELKYWDRIWNYYENQPETIQALKGIFYLLSHPDMKNIELSESSPFSSLFSDPQSLKEAIKKALSYVKNRLVPDETIKTQIKGISKESAKQEATFDVELKDIEINKIGFKRKNVTRLKHSCLSNSCGGHVELWTSNHYLNAKPDIYQTIKAAIVDGAFDRKPFHINISERHFRYPVYQHKQDFNIMLVLDISNSVKWILKFTEKIIAMLTAQAKAAKDKLGLIVFNDDRAQIMHYPTINVRHVIGTINTLAPKGKTPLAGGVRLALQTLEHSRFQVTGMCNAIVLLSDCFPEPITGEYRDQLDEPACQDLLHVCDKIAEANIKLLVLNPSVNTVKDYKHHIGFRLGTLAADRAHGSFLNLVAEASWGMDSSDRSYVLSKKTLNTCMQGISDFRMDSRY